MSSMAVKGWPFKVLFIFGNRKKSHGAVFGEYGGWGIVTVLYLAKNWRISSKVWAGALSWCKSHAFHTQNIRKNFMAWANRYANIISDFSDCDSAIVHNHFFHFFYVFINCWCAGAFGAFVIFNVVTAILETLIPLLSSCFTHSRLTFVNILHTLLHFISFFTQNLIQILWSISFNKQKSPSSWKHV